MKISKILKVIGSVAAMGVATIAAGKFGESAKMNWNEATAKDDDSCNAIPDNLDEIDDEEIKEMVIEDNND